MMTVSNRILRGIAFAARLDIAASVTIAVALLIWTVWH
jgi:hypothetical protein